jgi:hypothetical protein
MHKDRKMHIYVYIITEIITFCFFAGPLNAAASTAEFIRVRIWKKVVKQFFNILPQNFLGQMSKAKINVSQDSLCGLRFDFWTSRR